MHHTRLPRWTRRARLQRTREEWRQTREKKRHTQRKKPTDQHTHTNIHCRPRIEKATFFPHSINNLFVFSLCWVREGFFFAVVTRRVVCGTGTKWKSKGNRVARNAWHRSSSTAFFVVVADTMPWVELPIERKRWRAQREMNEGNETALNCLSCWFTVRRSHANRIFYGWFCVRAWVVVAFFVRCSSKSENLNLIFMLLIEGHWYMRQRLSLS